MSVVVSLLRAIDRADGEALVMHVGEKPYVVTATGHAELAANALTVPAMTGMLEQLLPAESRQALNELGAVEYHLPSDPASPGTRYSVVAARGGDDIWIEVRRRKQPEAAPPGPREPAVPPETPAAETLPPLQELQPALPEGSDVPVSDEPELVLGDDSLLASFTEAETPALDEPAPIALDEPEPTVFEYGEPVHEEEPPPAPVAAELPAGATVDEPPVPETGRAEQPEPEPGPPRPDTHEEHRYVVRDVADRFELRLQTENDFYGRAAAGDDLDRDTPPFDDLAPAFDFTPAPEAAPEPAPVRDAVPPRRVTVRLEGEPSAGPVVQGQVRPARAPASPGPHASALHRLLKSAAVQGASALYVAPQAAPSLRVDGEMRVLDEPPMTAAELEIELRSLVAGDVEGAALPLGDFETRELQGVGRVQCLVFRDHRGLGAIFRMLPGRTVSAQKAGLSPGIQSLCTEPEGLLLVAGSQGSGKSTLVAALVDQINRTRRDHVITVESDIQFVHENHTSFISQREARDEPAFLEALRAAIREMPDVLVVDGVMNTEVASTVLDAASNGLVVASLAAPATAAALERFIGLVGGDRPDVRALVGEHLRGVVTQALLRKTGGGRAAAREVLVNVPAVAALIANAQLVQLPTALNGGRRVGMVPLNDALLELVQGGALDVRQAYRKSPDPAELVSMLKKAGFDTAFADSLAPADWPPPL